MQTEDFIAGLVRDAKQPVKAVSPWAMFGIWIAATFTALIVIALTLELRADLLDRLAEPLFVFELLLLLLLVLSGSLSVFWHAFPDFRQQNWAARAPLTLLSLYAGLLLFRALVPATTAEPYDFDHHTIVCAVCITLFAPLPAGVMLWLVRCGATALPARTGLFALLVSGAVGHLLLKLIEANDGVLHLLTAHLLPILALGALGWFIGRKILAW